MSSTKWSMPASKSQSATKEKNNDFQLALQPMPEIELIDPITGKLPKNYKQILAGKDKKLQDANSQSASKEINENNKFEFSLKPMPELALLDPVTGQLPRNYKEIVNLGSRTKRRSKDFNFQRSKIQNNDSTLSKAGHTYHRNMKIGPRKALFTNSKETTRLSSKSGLPRKSTKIQNPGVNESVLLDIEETEKRLFLQKKKPTVSTIKFPKHHATPVLKNTKGQRKRLASSNSSLEEFLKLEQQSKSPKGATAAKRSKDINLAASIHEITTKLAENRDMMNKIVMNDNQINKNLQEILGYLHKNNFKDRLELDNATKNASSTNEIEEYKENISENLIPLQPSIKNNLLVATLKNNFEKKVLFDLEIENCDSPLRKKDFGLQTPNTMLRSVSRRAKQQLLTLQDTPKTSM